MKSKLLDIIAASLIGVFFLLIIVVTIVMAVVVLLITMITGILGFGGGNYLKYSINVWLGFDNFLSAVLGGDPDESVSSRLGKARRRGSKWGVVADLVDLVARVFFGDLNHCERSIEHDEGKDQVTTY